VNTVKRLLALTTVMLAAGCTVNVGRSVAPTTVPTTTVAPTTTTVRPTTTVRITAPPLSSEEEYLREAYRTVDMSGWTDGMLLQFSDVICGMFDDGRTLSEVSDAVYTSGVKNGFTRSELSEMAALTAAAVFYICPEYGDLML